MKERPILFSAEMVRAILEGSKTQTRRAVKPQPFWGERQGLQSAGWCFSSPKIALLSWPEDTFRKALQGHCPYGQPGDHIWVRETWAPFYLDGAGGCKYEQYHNEANAVRYAATPEYIVAYPQRATGWRDVTPLNVKHRWRPSIHMPRWASRITLEITSVRVERLHDISSYDAFEEGFPNNGGPLSTIALEWYRDLWISINGAESWATNPWVWVVEFKRVEK